MNGHGPYDPRPVDVWALAVMFYQLQFPEEIPWSDFENEIGSFQQYLMTNRTRVIHSLPNPAQGLIDRMLALEPSRRPAMPQILQDGWVKSLGKKKIVKR